MIALYEFWILLISSQFGGHFNFKHSYLILIPFLIVINLFGHSKQGGGLDAPSGSCSCHEDTERPHISR